jgi:tRNA(Ile)-lysidine synthase TilS/MesJ
MALAQRLQNSIVLPYNFHMNIDGKTLKKVLALIRRADTDFSMIRPGDRVMVGVSGGKDSLLLLTALAAYRQFASNPFEVCGGMIDLGFGDLDAAPLLAYCESIGVELHIKPTNIGHVVFETRQESRCAGDLSMSLPRNAAVIKSRSATTATTWWRRC